MPDIDVKKAGYLCVTALAVCVVMLYACTLGYEYIWDDFSYAASFRNYEVLIGAMRALTEGIFTSEMYYRPLAMLSFVVSQEPSVQHGINVFLHALNTVLVFQCVRALMSEEVSSSRLGLLVAALGALAFAAHPLAVEPVAWVSGRFDTLMCSFVLGTCLVALGGELTLRRLALVFVLFFAAMCSKEAAIGLPIALPFLLLLQYRLAVEETGARETVRRQVLLLTVLVLAAALYVVIRVLVIHRLFAGEEVKVTFAGGGVLDKLNVAALAVRDFARLLVNPWSHSAPLHPFKYEVGSGVLPQTAAVVVCVLALLVLVAIKKPRLNFPLALLAGLAVSWPAWHLVGIPNAENIISDRYALAPLALLLAGLAAAVAVWLARRSDTVLGKRMAAYAGAVCVLWIGALAAHTSVTLPIWRSQMAFLTFNYQRFPGLAQTHKGWIRVLMAQERWEDANLALEDFLRRHPQQLSEFVITDAAAWMLIRAKAGYYDDALAWRAAVESDQGRMARVLPNEAATFYASVATVEGDAGHWELALNYSEKAMQLTKGNDNGISFSYAQALFMNGQPEKANEVFNRALAGSTKEMATWALEWRKGWRLPEAAAEGAGQGASAPASAPAP